MHVQSKAILDSSSPSATAEAHPSLGESEHLYQQLMEGMPAAIYTCDANGYVTSFNSAAADLWGRKPVLGKDRWSGSWKLYWADGRPLTLDQSPMAIVLGGGHFVTGSEIIIERPDGTRRNVLPHPRPLVDRAGNRIGALNVLIDITERKRYEHELARTQAHLSTQVHTVSRLHDLAIRLAATNEPEPALAAILETLVEATEADWGLLSLHDPLSDRLMVRASVGYGPDGVQAIGLAASIGDEAFATGRCTVVEDLFTDPSLADCREFAKRTGFCSVWSTPITTRAGNTIGVICLQYATRREPTAEEKRLADYCARHAADSIDAAASRQALDESQQRFSQFMKHLPGLAWIKDRDGRYVYANEAALQTFSVTEDALYGKTDFEIFPESTAKQFRQNDAKAMSHEVGVQVVETLRQDDGIQHSSLVNKFTIPSTDGPLLGGIAIDITDRRRMEESLRDSEERFRIMADHAPVMIWVTEPDGRTTFLGKTWYDFTGRTPETSLGFGWADAVHPDDRIASRNAFLAANARHEPFTIEYRLLHCDGDYRWVMDKAMPRFGDDGAFLGYIGSVIDISKRKEVEEALRNSEQFYRAIGESIDYGVWICDPEGRNLYASDSFLKLVGITQQQCTDFGWADVLHPEDREATIAAWKECCRSGGVWDVEHRYRGVDGQYHPILARGVPVRNAQGEIIAWAGINLDISRLKQIENELREGDRRKDEFLALLAHELRNPLAPIRTGLELMRLASDDRAVMEEVRLTMDRQSQLMVRLIDDLLDVSRITRGTVELRKSRVELSSIIDSAIETARPVIEELDHQLNVHMPRRAVVLDADPTRLAQVVSNLLNNAAKYMKRGGRIELRAEQQGTSVTISVKDFGIGIPAHMIDRIFDLFIQVDGSMERSHGGLGIGLTLVKRLVEMHGGSVEVESDGPERGSRFTVKLPAVVELLNEPGPEGAEQLDARSKRRILIVDDNENAAHMLGMLLKALGNDVKTAYDGPTAIKLASEFRPDAILLDIGMPEMDGYETAQRIREQPWGKDVVLAALTGWGQEEDKRRTRESGFDHHFIKPVEAAVLQKFLSECEPLGR